MKYKYKFVKAVREFRHDFFYKEELEALMIKCGMEDLFNEKIKDHSIYRWSPWQIFAVLEGRLK